MSSEIASLPSEKQIETCLNEYRGKNTKRASVSSLIDSGDKDGALQIINALIVEQRQIPKTVSGYEDFNSMWKKMIIEDLKEVKHSTGCPKKPWTTTHS